MSWLKELKAGDQVIISTMRGERLVRVDRVTATQIIIGGGRYRKSDGYLMGNNNSWSLTNLVQCTPEQAIAIQMIEYRRDLEYKLGKAMEGDIKLKTLEAINELLMVDRL